MVQMNKTISHVIQITFWISMFLLGLILSNLINHNHQDLILNSEQYTFLDNNGSRYDFFVFENLTDLQTVCDNNDKSIGCTYGNDNKIYLHKRNDMKEFLTTCNHEMLHNILDLDIYEEEYGTSEEHKVILQTEDSISLVECVILTEEVYKISLNIWSNI